MWACRRSGERADREARNADEIQAWAALPPNTSALPLTFRQSRLTSHLNGVVQKEAVELPDGPFAAGQTEHILIVLFGS